MVQSLLKHPEGVTLGTKYLKSPLSSLPVWVLEHFSLFWFKTQISLKYSDLLKLLIIGWIVTKVIIPCINIHVNSLNMSQNVQYCSMKQTEWLKPLVNYWAIKHSSSKKNNINLSKNAPEFKGQHLFKLQ